MAELDPRSSDDEETLNLKLKAIQARLSLKKLTKRTSPRPSRPTTPPPKHSTQLPFASPIRSSTQVPASPSPRKPSLPASPARILLGIDKGRTGKDVSLRTSPEKPAKSFNQRINEARRHMTEKVTQAKQVSKVRAKKFTNIPAFNARSSSNEVPELDPPTKLRIRRRKASKEDVAIACEGRKLISISQFYALASPPNYEFPEDIVDFVIYGIIATKSDARTTTSNNPSKYCTIQLTDLKRDLLLFLYSQAWEENWKLPIGTLIYLLNPTISPPRIPSPMSIKATEAASIIEIASAADFGVCRSLTVYGSRCTRWINAKITEICEYHVDKGLKKGKNKRMEFAAGTRLFDPEELGERRADKARSLGYDPEFGSFFTGEQVDKARFDDANSLNNGERLRKEAERRQKEREVLAKLMSSGSGGAGNEYFETTSPMNPARDKDSGKLDDTDAVGESTKGGVESHVFNPVVLRRLGFDPTKKVATISKDKNSSLSLKRADTVKLDRRATVPGETSHKVEESDSDLEILF